MKYEKEQLMSLYKEEFYSRYDIESWLRTLSNNVDREENLEEYIKRNTDQNAKDVLFNLYSNISVCIGSIDLQGSNDGKISYLLGYIANQYLERVFDGLEEDRYYEFGDEFREKRADDGTNNQEL